MYLSSTPHKNETALPTKASNIKNEKTNFTFLFTETGLGAIRAINNKPIADAISFNMTNSGIKTMITAIIPPNKAEINNLLVEVGTFEKQAAKYSERISTVKFIKK